MKNKVIETLTEANLRSIVKDVIDQKQRELRVINTPQTYTFDEAARLLRISKRTLRTYIKQGYIEASSIGDPSRHNYRLTDQQMQDALHKPIPRKRKRKPEK